MTSVNGRITGLVSTFTTALASQDVEVVDSWVAANTSGTVLTVGLPDAGLRDIGALTQPAWRADQEAPDGFGQAPQLETLTVFCQVKIAPVDDQPDPSSVRAEYGAVVDACRASLSARDLGVQRVWINEGEGYQADGPSGFELYGTFSVVMVQIIG